MKSRWRHNPGFLAAAAAGSIGLLLAVVLGLQGAFRLLDDTPTGEDLSDDSLTAFPGDKSGDDWRGQSTEPTLGTDDAPPGGSSATLLADRRHDSDLGADEPLDDMSASKIAKAKGSADDRGDPFEMDDEAEADDGPVSIKPRRRHPVRENPLVEEDDSPRKTVQLPVDVDDDPETADSEADAEPDKIAAKSTTEKQSATKSTTGPSFGGDEADTTNRDTPDEPSESALPIANDKEPRAPGWKNQKSKPLPATDGPQSVAQKSSAVETVIYATPGTDTSASDDRAADAAVEVKPSRLLLEIAGPRSARVGQTCNFEIRVKNRGRTPVEKITLSVELPAELVHDVAQSLEQEVSMIGPGQTYRALVRTRAKASGEATLNADVAIDDETDAKTSGTIEIRPWAPSARAPRR
jgi:hypothetical protein